MYWVRDTQTTDMIDNRKGILEVLNSVRKILQWNRFPKKTKIKSPAAIFIFDKVSFFSMAL